MLIWRFRYHDGPAQVEGQVYGKDEAEGFTVAQRWCVLNGKRPPAKVFPAILAGPEILQQAAPRDPGLDESLPSPVEATTVANVSKGR